MKTETGILLNKIKKLNHLEKIADDAEMRYSAFPENVEYEKAFDAAYAAEYAAYMDVSSYIVDMSNGAVDFLTAKKLIKTKRNEILLLLK